MNNTQNCAVGPRVMEMSVGGENVLCDVERVVNRFTKKEELICIKS